MIIKKNDCEYVLYYVGGEKACQNAWQDLLDVMLAIVTRRHWLYPIIVAGQMVLLIIFWICTAFTKNNDFTKHYLNSAVVPMTLSVLAKLIMLLENQTSFYEWTMRDTLKQLDSYFATSYHYIFIVNTVIFMIMTLWTAIKRRAIRGHLVWLPYYIVYAIVAVCSVHTFMLNDYNVVTIAIAIATTISGTASLAVILLTLIMCFACCCCSNSKPNQDWSDPVVYNARSRMGWLIVFLFFLPATTAIDLMYGKDLQVDVFLLLFDLLSPYFILIPAFMFLPTYRSALFCCCENRRMKDAHPIGGKIIPVSNGPIEGVYSNNGQAQHLEPNILGQHEFGLNLNNLQYQDGTSGRYGDTQGQNLAPAQLYPVQQYLGPGTQNWAQMGQYPTTHHTPNEQPTHLIYPTQLQQSTQQSAPQAFLQNQKGLGNVPSAPFEASYGNALTLNQGNILANPHAQLAPIAPLRQEIIYPHLQNQYVGYGYAMGHQN